MKISEGLKLKGRPAEIPDCGRNDLPEFFKEMGFKRGIEVGVFQGEYTEVLAKSGLEIYGIDPWLQYEGYVYSTGKTKVYFNDMYEKAKERLSPYKNVKLIRKMSMDALSDFEDESLDFVYIDANHTFKYIAEDMYYWSYKIKDGGILCGHDYAYFRHRYIGGGCQVKEIVNAFSFSYDLDFWVLGRNKKIKGEIRDDYRSWMFIKDKNWIPK